MSRSSPTTPLGHGPQFAECSPPGRTPTRIRTQNLETRYELQSHGTEAVTAKAIVIGLSRTTAIGTPVPDWLDLRIYARVLQNLSSPEAERTRFLELPFSAASIAYWHKAPPVSGIRLGITVPNV
jgi:hypothetical protein